jgi:hypothetical protein
MTTRRALVYATLATQLLAGGTASAQGRGRGKHEVRHDDRPAATASGAQTQIHVVFSTHDTAIIREHYAPQSRRLPPGLAKKYARTGQLPPGWQKKMTSMPVALERRLAPLPAGYQRGVFEGHAVIYQPGGLIVDATVIF